MTIIWVRVDESRFLMKHQINYHQVFIRNEICFSSQAKYFLFYCFVWEDLSKKGVRASSRVPNTYGLVLLSVFRSLEPVRKHLPQFLTYFIKHKFVIHCFMVCCHWNSWFLIIFFFGGGVGVTASRLLSYVVSGGSHLGVFYSSQQLIIFLKQLPLNLTTNCAKYFAT